jgi:hypothetical protein
MYSNYSCPSNQGAKSALRQCFSQESPLFIIASFRNIYTSLMLDITRSTEKELARQISYLKAENQQSLDGISNRANGQLYKGKRIQIRWTAKEVVLPTIEGSRASGAIIKVASLTGRIRGMKFKRPDGRTVRPNLVVLDRPSTRVIQSRYTVRDTHSDQPSRFLKKCGFSYRDNNISLLIL